MLRPQSLPPVPEETARVARAALSPTHPYIALADELGALCTDERFADRFPTHGQPALAPWRLARATILQFAEGLSDRQAAQAIRGRIDWKDVRRSDLDDGGFDASVLGEFRGRLLTYGATTRRFDTLLAWCRERGHSKARGRQRTDSTSVWSAVRGLNRPELVSETMRHALNTLAAADPAWLRAHAQAAWVGRYARRADRERLSDKPAARDTRALAVGTDGYALLHALHAPDAPPWLHEIPAVAMLRLVWLQHDTRTDTEVRWRAEQDIPPAAAFINAPYDEDVHRASRRNMHRIGYKVHRTEACDDDQPPLIIHVETSAATTAAGDVTPAIHAALKDEQLLPGSTSSTPAIWMPRCS